MLHIHLVYNTVISTIAYSNESMEHFFSLLVFSCERLTIQQLFIVLLHDCTCKWLTVQFVCLYVVLRNWILLDKLCKEIDKYSSCFLLSANHDGLLALQTADAFLQQNCIRI